MIEIKHLQKIYGKNEIVNFKNLTVSTGEIFGLLGPNAAGKTTTIKMLTTLIEPTKCDVTFDKLNLTKEHSAIKRKIGYVAQYFSLYGELSVYDNLLFYAGLYGVKDIQYMEYLLQKYQLMEFKDKKAQFLSGGYQRRLALACALVHKPEILFLDEPTAGIDPLTRKILWDLFYDLSSEGKTIFITTHYMEEAQRCHKIAFLEHGKVIAQGSPEEVIQSLDEYELYLYSEPFQRGVIEALECLDMVYLINQFGLELRIMIKKGSDLSLVKKSMQPFVQSDEVILELSTANLEDVFIALTQDNMGEKVQGDIK